MTAVAVVSADAAVKTYWDQATGKWMKYDTNARKAAPVTPDGSATNQMGKPQQTYRNSNPVPRKTVDYNGPFKPNTIVVNTAERRLYYVMPNGKALKYGVGVGREGFTWAGVDPISRKAEWPGWTPPPEMIAREKKKGRILPAYMEGGPNNPLGARAMYIGGTLYRIHGTSEPWTIGTAVSSGCIRLTNDDVAHLYEHVRVGTRVVVLRGDESPARLAALANPPPPKKDEVMIAEARTKDDGLASIGVGVVVAGTIPADAATSPETTASVAPAPDVAVEEAVAVVEPAAVETAVVVPEASAKDDALTEVVVVEEAVAPADETVAAADPSSALPVDDAAKDDAAIDAVAAVATPTEGALEPAATEPVSLEPEQGYAAAARVVESAPVADTVEDTAADAAASDAPATVDPVAKDDGLATDLSGKTIPVNNTSPKLPDDTAAASTLVKPATVAN